MADEPSPWTRPGTLVVTCARGIPKFLARELAELGFPVLARSPAAVETQGSVTDAMRLNLELRTAQRVLYRLAQFPCRHADDLYKNVMQFPWERIFAAEGYLTVGSSVQHSTIRDSRYASLKCKDAVVDRIREQTGRRPDAGPDRSKAALWLHWRQDRCALFLDTTGEPLSKRGYRMEALRAPMQEALAAACILATGWDGSAPFVNPMCGSGTLAIEAALLAAGRPAGAGRENFAFMHVLGFSREAWNRLRSERGDRRENPARGRILASDVDRGAVAAARNNARRAGVEERIEFAVCDFRETDIPGGRGVVFLNPEYGQRTGEEHALLDTYRAIGDFFTRRCGGHIGYVFTGNPRLGEHIGLKPRSRTTLFNGDIECQLLAFPIRRGPPLTGRGGRSA